MTSLRARESTRQVSGHARFKVAERRLRPLGGWSEKTGDLCLVAESTSRSPTRRSSTLPRPPWPPTPITIAKMGKKQQ